MFWGVGPPGRASGGDVGTPAAGGSPGAPGTPGRGAGGAGRLVKGLLPGPRGTLRGTPGAAGPPGRPGTPGRGPAGRVAGAAGAAWAAGARGAGCSGCTVGGWTAGGCAAGGAGVLTTGAGAGATGLAGTASSGAGAAGLAAFAGAFFAGAAAGAAGAASPSASLSLRTTGGSTVDDADFTNSPRSFSFARTVLLSTPSSLASSWTRAFPATVLLFLGPRLPARPPTTAWEYSSLSAHRASIRQTHFRTAAVAQCLPCCASLPRLSRWARTRSISGLPVIRSARRNACRRIADSRHCRSGCRCAPLPGSRRRGSGTRTPSTTTTRSKSVSTARLRHPTHVRIGAERRAVSTVARSAGLASGTTRRQPFAAAEGSALTGRETAGAPGASVSLWMSIRQPVRRAARRAFCPSLPIASES